jgi:hypothetical protein
MCGRANSARDVGHMQAGSSLDSVAPFVRASVAVPKSSARTSLPHQDRPMGRPFRCRRLDRLHIAIGWHVGRSSDRTPPLSAGTHLSGVRLALHFAPPNASKWRQHIHLQPFTRQLSEPQLTARSGFGSRRSLVQIQSPRLIEVQAPQRLRPLRGFCLSAVVRVRPLSSHHRISIPEPPALIRKSLRHLAAGSLLPQHLRR